ncbi:ORF_21 [Adoxophyes orana granulovirus]|uniref:ORF_21 n=1 Tax=Adoxophyes orana granulovirus TaxID=170617 RepID=Q7T9Z4_GVAO|nr:ORF_21 [Adoxophyes orana granulovirus]AAP85658.1 ORF_21 [Adoxophyes orana granulovirus]
MIIFSCYRMTAFTNEQIIEVVQCNSKRYMCPVEKLHSPTHFLVKVLNAHLHLINKEYDNVTAILNELTQSILNRNDPLNLRYSVSVREESSPRNKRNPLNLKFDMPVETPKVAERIVRKRHTISHEMDHATAAKIKRWSQSRDTIDLQYALCPLTPLPRSSPSFEIAATPMPGSISPVDLSKLPSASIYEAEINSEDSSSEDENDEEMEKVQADKSPLPTSEFRYNDAPSPSRLLSPCPSIDDDVPTTKPKRRVTRKSSASLRNRKAFVLIKTQSGNKTFLNIKWGAVSYLRSKTNDENLSICMVQSEDANINHINMKDLWMQCKKKIINEVEDVKDTQMRVISCDVNKETQVKRVFEKYFAQHNFELKPSLR